MNHGFQEIRTTRMEPGPDGKLVPHVYVERREFSPEEAQEVMKEHEKMFSGFDELNSAVEKIFGQMDGFFSKVSKGFKKSFMERHDGGKVGR